MSPAAARTRAVRDDPAGFARAALRVAPPGRIVEEILQFSRDAGQITHPAPTIGLAVEPPGRLLEDYTRDDAGHPLGHGMPMGRTLRGEDGTSHREGWMALLRLDPCAYCGEAGGTVDHVEPRSQPARGLGGAHCWTNYVGACERCNSSKGAKPMLQWLLGRRGVGRSRRG